MPFPNGTVTFLFTDIEGSTRLWEEHPEAMRAALSRHDALLRQAIADNDGTVFKTIGDAFCAAFATAPTALTAALTAQHALNLPPGGEGLTLRVRMALHTGAAVVPAFTIWDPELRKYRVQFDAALELVNTGDSDADAVANTALFNRVLEGYIRKYPDQWLWVHRRWKTRPPGEGPLY